MTLAFSRRLALGAGLFLPAIETWRRWGQFGQLSKWPVIFDDFLAGGFLVLGALACRRSLPLGDGRRLQGVLVWAQSRRPRRGAPNAAVQMIAWTHGRWWVWTSHKMFVRAARIEQPVVARA